MSTTRFALVANGVVMTMVDQDSDKVGELPVVGGDWIACGMEVGPGWTYNGSAFEAPAPAATGPVWARYIDIGPFFDRFGAAKINVLMSTNAGVKAVVADCQVRKWIDLDRPDVAAGIDVIIAAGVSGVDAALKNTILTTPVAPEENLALRKLYF